MKSIVSRIAGILGMVGLAMLAFILVNAPSGNLPSASAWQTTCSYQVKVFMVNGTMPTTVTITCHNGLVHNPAGDWNSGTNQWVNYCNLDEIVITYPTSVCKAPSDTPCMQVRGINPDGSVRTISTYYLQHRYEKHYRLSGECRDPNGTPSSIAAAVLLDSKSCLNDDDW